MDCSKHFIPQKVFYFRLELNPSLHACQFAALTTRPPRPLIFQNYVLYIPWQISGLRFSHRPSFSRNYRNMKPTMWPLWSLAALQHRCKTHPVRTTPIKNKLESKWWSIGRNKCVGRMNRIDCCQDRQPRTSNNRPLWICIMSHIFSCN